MLYCFRGPLQSLNDYVSFQLGMSLLREKKETGAVEGRAKTQGNTSALNSRPLLAMHISFMEDRPG